MLKGATDPQQILNRMLKNNPNAAELQELIKQNGGNPEKAFKAKAAELGIDPNDIMGILK